MNSQRKIVIFIFAAHICQSVYPAEADLIPAERITSWLVGESVGVPGGIDQYLTSRNSRIDVTQPPYNADKSGTSDAQPAIQAAIAAAGLGSVIYLPTGIYRLNKGISLGAKDNITVRGDGSGTVLKAYNDSGYAFYFGSGSAWNWSWPPSGYEVNSGGVSGSEEVTIANADLYSVGDIVRFQSGNSTTLPVVNVSGWDGSQRQLAIITAKSTNAISFKPPLIYSLGSNPSLKVATHHSKFVGVEDLTIDCSNAGAGFGLQMEQCYSCWVSNVRIKGAPNYNLYINNSLNCEIRGCTLDEIRHSGSNGAGLLFERSTCCLVEDNIIYKAFPLIEVNHGSVGNVFAYNFCENSESFTVIGAGIDTNHAPHNCFNLYEGNIVSKLQADGYFGGASDDTVFRNWIHGSSPNSDLFSICVNLNRFTRNYNLIANVLGVTDYNFDFYDNGRGAGTTYAKRYIYALGFPNIGNLGGSGFVEPSIGSRWADWSKYTDSLAKNNGSGPGPGGFQEYDLDVANTTIRKWNWNAIDRGIRESEQTQDSVPNSLFRQVKPTYFGNLAWPPIGPERTQDWEPAVSSLSSIAIIPAQARYYGLEYVGARPSRVSGQREAPKAAAP